jgi:hypothetical protein
MSKQYNTSSIQNELAGASLFFPKKAAPQAETKSTPKVTRKSTRPRGLSRDKSRGLSRSQSPDHKSWPSRDEIQEFSFKLRDEHKVKVQAEVPPQWQKEFDDLTYALGVKKLELYRFILGEFLGKVQRKPAR